MDVRFFEQPGEWRAWLAENHETETEVWVGFRRKHSGLPSITWPEAVEEALCFGWIDGVRRSVDETSYANRFTPRRKGSAWSRINIAAAERLIREGRMRPRGLAAFEARTAERADVERRDELPPEYAAQLEADPAAREHFASQPPWYRRAVVHWIMSAKREETRRRRLAQLIERSAQGRAVPPLTRPS